MADYSGGPAGAEAKVRSYVDTNYSKYGIDWRERKRLGNSAFGDYVRSKLAASLGPEDQWTPAHRELYKNLLLGSDYLSQPGAFSGTNAKAFAFADQLGANPEDTFNAQRPENQAPAAAGPATPEVDPNQAEWDKINGYIDDLVQQLRTPSVDPVTGKVNDSIYETLLKGGATAGMSSATMRGVGGPLAGNNAMDSARSAALPYEMQKQSLLVNALGMQDARNRGGEALRQGAAGLQLQEAAFNNGVATNNWAGQQNKDQGVLGTIGAVGGGILGGLIGKSPQAAYYGAKAGSGLLAGAGTSTSPAPNIQPIKPYKSGIR